MSIKQKINNLVAPLYNKVWHAPKACIRQKRIAGSNPACSAR